MEIYVTADKYKSDDNHLGEQLKVIFKGFLDFPTFLIFPRIFFSIETLVSTISFPSEAKLD